MEREILAQRARGYAIGIVAALVALAMRAAVEPWLHGGLPYLLAFGGVAVALWGGGTGPAIAAAVIGYVGSNLVVHGDWSFGMATLGRGYPMALVGYSFSCLALIGFGAAIRRSQDRLLLEIDERRRAEEAARRSEQALLEVDRRRNEFIATLAHELRNPLAPIRNSLEILRRAGPEGAARERALGVMERQVTHMVRLIDDLIDVGRIGRGEIQLRRGPVELASVVHAACETCEPLVGAKAHRLEVELPERAVTVDGDPARLTQVLANLLDNAAKYTPAGGRLAVRVHAVDGAVEIEVTDSGIGIAPHMLPHVFEMFTRVEHGADAAPPGLGIGLALSRRLVELHGGSLDAESAGEGRGSRFVVRLPQPSGPARVQGRAAPRSEAPAAPATTLPTGAPLRILVVDDNVDAATSLRAILELDGHDVRAAHDGRAALALADDLRPQLALLDIGMPGMDGCELAAHLKRRPWADRLVLVAVTGWGHEADRRRSAEAGFARHLVKPVEPSDLATLVASAQAETGVQQA